MVIELHRDKPMRRLFAPVLLLAAAGCGTRNDKAVAQFSLTSPAFQNGQRIPVQFTCDGASQSPPLRWGEPPPGTTSFALVVDDPDAPGGTFRHWADYDIPADRRSIAAGQAIASQAENDFGERGYGAPCPPKGHGAHHYRFKLVALDVGRLDVPVNPRIAEVEREAAKHAIGRADLTGIYERR